MAELRIEVPRMFADHHVTEVRRLLTGLPGVLKVNASSAFHTVEITFEADQQTEDSLRDILDKAGYLGPLEVPLETGDATMSLDTNGQRYFRHSTTVEAAGKAVSFAQQVNYTGRPLWPCPGMQRPPTDDQ